MREIGPFNQKVRRRTKTSERHDYHFILHRHYDDRTVARCVMAGIEIAVGNDGIAEMKGTVY
jgi:hypothetical protein